MIWVAKGDPGQTLFVLLDEPETSKAAKFISIYMQVRLSDCDCVTELSPWE
jgi:hypothetical protein